MKVAAAIFDLDGTLTRPVLDFDAIRREIGDVEGPLLEAMEQMSSAERQRAAAILERHERSAAENSELNGGVQELLAWLRGEGRAIGVVTRNQRRSVEKICEVHGLVFDAVVTREDGPAKPDPFGVRRVCELLGIASSRAVVVGDYVFDLISARRAGARGVLLTTNENHADFVAEADYVIDHLEELPAVIEKIENGLATGSA